MKDLFTPPLKFCTFILFLATFFNGYGQEECGTPTPENYQTYERTEQERGYNRQTINTSSNICVKVKFHIVRETNQTGGINPNQLNQIINVLENNFINYNISFINVGFDYINNSQFYNNFREEDFSMWVNYENFRVDHAINVFIVDNIVGYRGLALTPSNVLVIEKNWATQSTIVHEMGHCFNLLHTHQGYNGIGGCAEIPDPDDCSVSLNGTSCGDRISDTPADNRTGVNGAYCPDITNFMSYYNYNSLNHFTPDQAIRMRDALSSYLPLQMVQCVETVSDDVVCSDSTTTFSIIGGQPPYNWTVSQNIQIISNSGNSIEVRAINSQTSNTGWVEVNYGSGSSEHFDVWVGVPLSPTSITGPSQVSYDALVNYQCGVSQGAKYYAWWLPYPFDIVQAGDPPLYFNDNWWMFENHSRYIQAYTADGSVGDRSGYVQAMGANKCGLGGAKFIWVDQGPGGNGGIRIVAYPNEADNELNVDLSQMPNGTLYVYLYDSNYNLKYYGEQTNDTIKTINTLGLNEGIYYLHVYDGVTVETKQIIINH